jgi:hypothetical protein
MATDGKHYFSKAQNLFLSLRVGRKELIDGEIKRVDDKYAQFTPIGDGFGRFFTKDPETIELMDARIAEVGDIFGPDEYQKRSVPAEKRNEMLERELSQANELIKQLQKSGKLPTK